MYILYMYMYMYIHVYFSFSISFIIAFFLLDINTCNIKEEANPSSCWQTSYLPGTLEKVNTRSIGFKHNKGLPAQSHLPFIPEGCTPPTCLQTKTATSSVNRNTCTRELMKGAKRHS